MRAAALIFATSILFALAGCGGSSNESESAVSTTASESATTVASTTRVNPGTRSSGDPQFTIELKGESHYAHAGQPWKFRVMASQANQPVSGTAKVYVFQGTNQVDGVGWFSFKGSLEQTYTWPDKLIDMRSVYLHVDVEGPGGVRRANWPVTVEAVSK